MILEKESVSSVAKKRVKIFDYFSVYLLFRVKPRQDVTC